MKMSHTNFNILFFKSRKKSPITDLPCSGQNKKAVKTEGDSRSYAIFEIFEARARFAGPTRGSAGNNSRVMLARPASDPFLAGHDLTRPVSFYLLTRPDPTREV